MQLHTYADLQAVPPKRMWQLLRTMRHKPVPPEYSIAWPDLLLGLRA